MSLRIGTAGIPHSAKPRSTEGGIKRVAELGMGCMEIEFVRSVQMKEPRAAKVKEVAEAEGIELTVHAPYYVNLNSREADKVAASRERILKAARVGWAAGAQSVTFHAAFYHDDAHGDVYNKVRREMHELRRILDDEGNGIDLRPETTGSPTQFGTVSEIVKLSQEIDGVYPCIDFSHLHARTNGEYNTYDAFAELLEFIQKELGDEPLRRLHMHLSGIDYGPKGEKKHLVFPEADMNYEAVLEALIDYHVSGWLICESPVLEDDAQILQDAYNRLRSKT